MKIELKAGRHYETEDGQRGEFFVWDSTVEHPFECLDISSRNGAAALYRPDGTSDYASPVVREVAAPGFELAVGDYVRLADGSVAGPMRRDNRYGFRKQNLFVADEFRTPGGTALQVWEADGSIYGCSPAEKLLHAVEKVDAPAVAQDTSSDFEDGPIHVQDGDYVVLKDGRSIGPAKVDRYGGAYFSVDGFRCASLGCDQVWRVDGKVFHQRHDEEGHEVVAVVKRGKKAGEQVLTIKPDMSEVRAMLDAAAKELDAAVAQVAERDEELRAAKESFAILAREKDEEKLKAERLGDRLKAESAELEAAGRTICSLATKSIELTHRLVGSEQEVYDLREQARALERSNSETLDDAMVILDNSKKLFTQKAKVDVRLRGERRKRRALQARVKNLEDELRNVAHGSVVGGICILAASVAFTVAATLALAL